MAIFGIYVRFLGCGPTHVLMMFIAYPTRWLNSAGWTHTTGTRGSCERRFVLEPMGKGLFSPWRCCYGWGFGKAEKDGEEDVFQATLMMEKVHLHTHVTEHKSCHSCLVNEPQLLEIHWRPPRPQALQSFEANFLKERPWTNAPAVTSRGSTKTYAGIAARWWGGRFFGILF